MDALSKALVAAEARPEPAQCRPHCTTMATDCDVCRPEPAAEPLVEVLTLIRQGNESLNAGFVIPTLRSALMAIEALAREVRR